MSAVVLDASAGAEIVVGSTLGRRLLALAPRDRAWSVPDHFHVECAGAVRRMLLKGLIDEARASAVLARLLSLPVTVSRSNLLIAEAWTYRNNLIVHDAVYIVLAKRLGAPVLTGDRKMAGARQPSRPGAPYLLAQGRSAGAALGSDGARFFDGDRHRLVLAQRRTFPQAVEDRR